MQGTILQMPNGYYLGQITAPLVHHTLEALNNDVLRSTLRALPHPYTQTEGLDWVNLVEHERQVHGYLTKFSVFSPDGVPIGGIGLNDFKPGHHKAELGYWINPNYWGLGLATAAINTIVPYAFSTLLLTRVYAYVFTFNPASVRVLEKAGFTYEGLLRKDYTRSPGDFIDVYVYAMVV